MPEPEQVLSQLAPYPVELEELVATLEYRPGWRVDLADVLRDQDHGRGEGRGLTLRVWTVGHDTYHPELGQNYRVVHYFIVPAATYDRESWRRWLLDRMIDVEIHECCEFFRFVTKGDGERTPDFVERPFAPHHGPGQNPYTVIQHGTDEQRRTAFTGVVND